MTQNVLTKKDSGVERVASRGMFVFLIIWIGQVVSLVGSGMTCFAQTVTVYEIEESVMHIGLLAVLGQLPGILGSPIAGVLADRWDRRWMMIICDSVAALGTLSLRLLILGGSYQIWQVYVIVIIISIANHFQWPAYFASISSLVPKQQLGRANGLIATGRALGQIAAPVMAGVAVTIFKIEGVLLFDLSTFLFALVTLLFVRIPKPEASETHEAGRGSFLQEAIYGWKYLVARPGLLGVTTLVAAGNFALGGIGVLLLPLVLSMASAQVYGGLASLGGISMLVGSLVVSAWGGPKNRVYGLLGFVALQGVAIVFGGLRPSLALFFISAVAFYFVMPFINVCGQLLWQTKVASSVQGRVLAITGMITMLAMEMGILATAWLTDIVEPLFVEGIGLAATVGLIIGTGHGRGMAFVFILLGVLCVILALVGRLHPRIRFLEDELPDVLPSLKLAGETAKATLYEVDFEGGFASVKLGPSSGKQIKE